MRLPKKPLHPALREKHSPKTIHHEARFLAIRHSRLKEAWRVLRIAFEFIRGFRTFHFLPPAVTIFGSARLKEGNHYYELARTMGKLVASEGYVVVTGGGPGTMEAASRGAKDVGGITVGANILLPTEQKPNPYLDRVVTFHYFFVRKVILMKYSYAFLVLPGGFGTLDEMTEALTLIQTGKVYDFPVILMGREYWMGLYDWMRTELIKNGTIGPDDLHFMTITDDPNEAIEIIRRSARQIDLPLVPVDAQ